MWSLVFWKLTWKCSHSPKTNIFIKVFKLLRYPKNAPNHILSSNSAGEIVKMAIKSELLGLCSWNFWNFLFSMRLSNSEYFKDFKIFDLPWIWLICLEWPICLYVFALRFSFTVKASVKVLTPLLQTPY